MRRSLFLFAAATFGVGLAQRPAQGGTVADVRFLSGAESAQVRFGSHLPWHRYEAKSIVPEQAEVMCEATCRLKVDVDNELILAPGTIIAIGAYFYVPLVSTASLTPAHEIKLREGHVDARSPSEKSIPLVISGPGTTHVAFRGADVQVAVKDERMVAQVNEGSARAGSNKRWISVDKAQATSMRADGYPTEPRAETAAPAWQTADGCAAPLNVVLAGGAAPAGVCWQPAAQGATYVLELSRDEAFTTIDQTETTTSTSWTKSLPEGRYFVRTRAVDEDTMKSRLSPVRKLGVVSFALPPGATANLSARSVVLPQGRSFDLRDTTGLETAIDRGVFVTVRRPFVMDAEASHTMRLRLEGDASSESSIELRKRELRADIDIGPKSARWPVDPVDITVTVRDPGGLVDAAEVTPKLRVTLGLTEFPVAWTHRGPVWTARLAPRNIGPTVIRVIAEDEFGNTLGRHFLEVDERPLHPGEAPSAPRRIATN